MESLGWTEEDLLNARSVVPEKQAVAWLIKSHTAVTGRWIAERLHMGHPENASRGINRFRRAETREVKKLKRLMSKCVGDPNADLIKPPAVESLDFSKLVDRRAGGAVRRFNLAGERR